MGVIAGWLAIALAIFSLTPSFVPGAFSVFGLLISLAALIVAVFSVRKTGMRFFKVTMAIVIIGVFFVNDGLRMWNPLEMPINMKLSLYGISFFVVIGCAFCANALARSKKQS